MTRTYDMKTDSQFGSTAEAIIYPFLLLIVIWSVFWADHLFPLIDFYKLGVMPKDIDGLKGVLFMPLIHSNSGFEHIVNNSIPSAVLLGAIIYYYRPVALRVFFFSWILSGLGVWLFAENTNSYHIGISGIIYAMAAFLFTSGVLRKHRPLQAISLFVAFVYGSLIWGVFPTPTHVSWEGHLMGLLAGVVLAIAYRKIGPQPPKYLYELEHEMGIEPPDYEGEWNEKVRLEEVKREQVKKSDAEEGVENKHKSIQIKYHYVKKNKGDRLKDDTD